MICRNKPSEIIAETAPKSFVEGGIGFVFAKIENIIDKFKCVLNLVGIGKFCEGKRLAKILKVFLFENVNIII